MNKGNLHEPVLVQEVIEFLHIKNQARYIDATLGTGGHSLEILKKGGRVLGIEEDPEMLKIALERLKACPTPNQKVGGLAFELASGNFRNIDRIAKDAGFDQVDGIIFDLGVSTPQLTSGIRGFSFEKRESDLDMRLNPAAQDLKASDLLNVLREDQLKILFGKVMGWQDTQRLVKAIVFFRNLKPISSVGDFLEICKVIKGKSDLHRATLPFLALRVAVNSELENLTEALPKAYTLLTKGGRLLVISFHSGEDKIVKNFFRIKREEGAKWLTEKPITPSAKEIEGNPRSRSAKLRVLEKI